MAAHMARKALYVYGAFCILLFAKASYECESKYLHFLRWLKRELWVILKMEFEKRVKTILKFAPRPRASTRLSMYDHCAVIARKTNLIIYSNNLWFNEGQLKVFFLSLTLVTSDKNIVMFNLLRAKLDRMKCNSQIIFQSKIPVSFLLNIYAW